MFKDKVLAMRCAGYSNVEFKAEHEVDLTVVYVFAELDILNAYERIRPCCINMAETLAGCK